MNLRDNVSNFEHKASELAAQHAIADANIERALAEIFGHPVIWPGFGGVVFLESSGVQRGGSRAQEVSSADA